MPRILLLLFCAAYVLPGFVGRAPWKSADMTSFGYMLALAQGQGSFFAPQLMGLAPETDSLLSYWLGAMAIKLGNGWLSPDVAVRVPFVGLLVVTLYAVWYATYYFARSPRAQPVAFAFGGEAAPTDYARAIADGGLLAFIACLGLAQLSHETTPAVVQLGCVAACFYALAAMPYRVLSPVIVGLLGMLGLTLSGQPVVAALLGLGGAIIHAFDSTPDPVSGTRRIAWTWAIALCTLLMLALATSLSLWGDNAHRSQHVVQDTRDLAQLLLWFTWPAWPLAIWTLWRWRLQLLGGQLSRHLAMPLWFLLVTLGSLWFTPSTDRALLLGLPALACLAAFALPTLGRSVAALIDWFTLLFFCGCAVSIWVIWIAMQTGIPSAPAANVQRLFPGFAPHFSVAPFLIAVGASVSWAWLVKWRVGRHRAALWKSLVLPASGAALCWLLLTTLWLPLLDFARSYVPMIHSAKQVFKDATCVHVHGLNRGEIAALQFHGQTLARPLTAHPECRWLMADGNAITSLPAGVEINHWALRSRVRHPADRSDKNADFLIYERIAVDALRAPLQ